MSFLNISNLLTSLSPNSQISLNLTSMYRVLGNCTPKIFAYCSENMSKRDLNSLILMNYSGIQFLGNYHQKMFFKSCKSH